MNKEEALKSNWVKFFVGIAAIMLAPIWIPIYLLSALGYILFMCVIETGDGILNGFDRMEE